MIKNKQWQKNIYQIKNNTNVNMRKKNIFINRNKWCNSSKKEGYQ